MKTLVRPRTLAADQFVREMKTLPGRSLCEHTISYYPKYSKVSTTPNMFADVYCDYSFSVKLQVNPAYLTFLQLTSLAS